MTQKLASAVSDGRPLDFGTITFDASGHMVVTRGAYNMRWTDFTASDVILTDVADDYSLPAAARPAPTAGRNIDRTQFLDVGEATDAVKFNAVLAQMPAVGLYLDDYKDNAGIKFGDAVVNSRLSRLLSDAIAANLIDQATVTAFLAKWVQLYPAV